MHFVGICLLAWKYGRTLKIRFHHQDDTSGPRQFIKNLEEALDPATFNRVMFSVDFPENDNRSLIEVPEVRAYFRQLFFEVDSLFLWLDPDAPMFWCMGLLISNLDVMGKASPQFVVFDYQSMVFGRFTSSSNPLR